MAETGIQDFVSIRMYVVAKSSSYSSFARNRRGIGGDEIKDKIKEEKKARELRRHVIYIGSVKYSELSLKYREFESHHIYVIFYVN